MKAFAKLLSDIEQTNSTSEKVDLMTAFFRSAEPEEAAWGLYFLSGQRPKRFIGSAKLRTWAEELAGLPPWLAEECYSAVGDTAETIALIVAPMKRARDGGARPDETEAADLPIATWMRERIEPLRNADESAQKATIQSWWSELPTRETFVLNKLMTGALRIGVSETLVYRAMSEAFEIPRPTVAARLLGKWSPSAEFFAKITRPPERDEADLPVDESASEALPVPFCLAAALEVEPAELGPIADWQLEWKWDGIRAQVVKVGPKIELWSRGEERITESFPDLVETFAKVPGDFTLDGEILAGWAGEFSSFNELQKRLNRKRPTATFLAENPVAFQAYDFLRDGAASLANRPLADRRAALEAFVARNGSRAFGLSPVIGAADWESAANLQAKSRGYRAEGIMLKRKDAPYVTGRKRGIWYKWKVDPLTLDVVLTAAQPGSGRRASLYTDYTFGIWKGDTLVPIAKAYSGLSDAEIRELDAWIRKNTEGRFGPVRTLKPERVFEIGFEGIAASSRHKSGFAVRFPRILRERLDKPAAEADRVETVEALVRSLESHRPAPEREPDLFSPRASVSGEDAHP